MAKPNKWDIDIRPVKIYLTQVATYRNKLKVNAGSPSAGFDTGRNSSFWKIILEYRPHSTTPGVSPVLRSKIVSK